MNNTSETTLDVTGMRCGACVRHVSTALRGLDSVTDVEVRLKDGKVVVRHDPTRLTVVDLIAALDRAGYGSQLGAAA